MAAAAVSSVEEVLKARDTARRIKETYDGTLGVPGELKSLGHLLAHDKEAIFTGLESLPQYAKSKVLPPPPPPDVTPVQHRHRRHHHHPEASLGASVFSSAHGLAALAEGSPAARTPENGTPHSSRPASPPLRPLPPMPAAEASNDKELLSTATATALMDIRQWGSYGGLAQHVTGRRSPHHHRHRSPHHQPSHQQQQQPLRTSQDLGSPHPSPPQSPPPPLPYPGRAGEVAALRGRGSPMSSSSPSPCDPMRTSQEGQEGVRGGRSRPRQQPAWTADGALRDTSAGGGAGPGAGAPAQQQSEQPWQMRSPASSHPGWSTPTRGDCSGGGGGGGVSGGGTSGGASAAGGGGRGFSSAMTMSLDSWTCGYASRSGSESGSGSAYSGSACSSDAEAEGGCKQHPHQHRSSRHSQPHQHQQQRRPKAPPPGSIMSPQDWARVGAPQDSVDESKFVARSYSVQVDWEPHTLTAKRVARPDIFHITPEEAHRRQMEADEATLALQARRRAERQAAEHAAEQERQARIAQRTPRYNGFGVLHGDLPSAAARPRYLDWHPAGVGGLQPLQQKEMQQQQLQQQMLLRGSVNGRGTTMAGGGGGGGEGGYVGPGAPRCASAHRCRSDASGGAAPAGMYAGSNSGGGHVMMRSAPASARVLNPKPHPEMPTTTTALPDGFIYEDLSDDPANPTADGSAPPPVYAVPRPHSALPTYSSPYPHVPNTSTNPATATITTAPTVSSFLAPPSRPAGVSDAHYAQILRQQRKWLNAPAQPPRPISAAPQPTPPSKFYVRPQSSRPVPEGTAAPVPSRLAAAAQVAVQRPNSALRTVITERCVSMNQRNAVLGGGGGGGGSRPGSGQSRKEGGGGGGSRAGTGTGARPISPGAATHAAAAAGGSAAAGGAAGRGVRRPSGDAAEAWGRPRSTAGGCGSSGPRSRPGSAAQQHQQPQPQPQREAVVFGETVPPEAWSAGGGEGERYPPRKFAMHSDMVGVMLEGYANREAAGGRGARG
ncbi:hypothetical protein Agub_g10134 [Astrephomene gubernaculifera]|uniref:Uncharacterized protein n=1 Tax=Astrephomene gubernaculifera TaxID=47775 RepID=A0AAD3DUA4_9CHLO|nr:hypothetical protein Agub_g10134 [Astrephomene gubernaculifera]